MLIIRSASYGLTLKIYWIRFSGSVFAGSRNRNFLTNFFCGSLTTLRWILYSMVFSSYNTTWHIIQVALVGMWLKGEIRVLKELFLSFINFLSQQIFLKCLLYAYWRPIVQLFLYVLLILSTWEGIREWSAYKKITLGVVRVCSCADSCSMHVLKRDFKINRVSLMQYYLVLFWKWCTLHWIKKFHVTVCSLNFLSSQGTAPPTASTGRVSVFLSSILYSGI